MSGCEEEEIGVGEEVNWGGELFTGEESVRVVSCVGSICVETEGGERDKGVEKGI